MVRGKLSISKKDPLTQLDNLSQESDLEFESQSPPLDSDLENSSSNSSEIYVSKRKKRRRKVKVVKDSATLVLAPQILTSILNSNSPPNTNPIKDSKPISTVDPSLRNKGKVGKKGKPEKPPKVPPTPINLDLRFEDLGGLEDQIALIRDEIIFCHQYAPSLRAFGIDPSVGGVLLEGPPGTGKTLCAHTIAAELVRQTGRNYTFYTHNAAACLSKWIGETERNIRDLFEAAAEHKPSIIFFDEFDAICPKRENERATQEHRTLVATILSEFNKIQVNEILVIATTNLVSNIDPAMIREGRFDFIVNFPMPDEAQRRNIVQIKMKNFHMSPDLLDYVARETEGFPGSALSVLCDRAMRSAFKRILQLNKGKGHSVPSWTEKQIQGFKKMLDREDFELVLKSSRFGREYGGGNLNSSSSSTGSSKVLRTKPKS